MESGMAFGIEAVTETLLISVVEAVMKSRVKSGMESGVESVGTTDSRTGDRAGLPDPAGGEHLPDQLGHSQGSPWAPSAHKASWRPSCGPRWRPN